MHYHISYQNPSAHFIQFSFTIPAIHQDIIHVQLPSWRPGRYELQNYAKNIRKFSICDTQNNPVSYCKTGKDRWEIYTKNITGIVITYEYYANQPDAGASYLGEDFFYINPVNCCMYMEGRMDEPYTLQLDLPENYRIASQLTSTGNNTLTAPNFDYLADSPIIASDTLVTYQCEINNGNNRLHFWMQGKQELPIERLIADTIRYAESQTTLFGDMPSVNYNFLYIFLPNPFRHGVEHLDSTVIAMGKGEDTTNEEFYQDLLAISCHELFHLWNIKRIRPADMLPYDFTKENYSTLGYIYEGITTYYGDLMLARSGVWSWEQYQKSLCDDLKRHFENEGRFNYSVAESSWDTWLDGYTAGIPGRKVSIYMEGLIAAWIADIIILDQTNGKYRLDDVLKELYQHDAKQSIGYTEARYRELLEKYAGISFDAYFKEIIHGKGYMEVWLHEIAGLLGIKITGTEGEMPLKINLHILSNSDEKQQKRFKTWFQSL